MVSTSGTPRSTHFQLVRSPLTHTYCSVVAPLARASRLTLLVIVAHPNTRHGVPATAPGPSGTGATRAGARARAPPRGRRGDPGAPLLPPGASATSSTSPPARASAAATTCTAWGRGASASTPAASTRSSTPTRVPRRLLAGQGASFWSGSASPRRGSSRGVEVPQIHGCRRWGWRIEIQQRPPPFVILRAGRPTAGHDRVTKGR